MRADASNRPVNAAVAVPGASPGGRDRSIDALRGFAILLVVLGHAIQYNSASFDSSLVVRFIYSFHMPLFMLISGYLAFGRVEGRPWAVIKRKALQLAVPFFAWTLVMSLLNDPSGRSIAQDYMHLIRSPDYGLWFLWVLFLAFSVMALLRVSQKLPAFLMIIVAAYALRELSGIVPALALLSWQFPFFGAGYLCASYYRAIKRFQLPFFLVSVVAFALLLPGWYLWSQPWIVEWLESQGVGVAITSWVALLYRYAIAFAGIGVFWGIFVFYGRALGASLVGFAWFGLLSMDIYVSHVIFVRLGWWPESPEWLAVLCGFAAGILGSLVTSIVLRQSRLASGVFLGSRRLPRTLFPPLVEEGVSWSARRGSVAAK